MSYSLTFSTEHDYSAEHAVSIPVKLLFGSNAVSLDAYVDTGSTFCIFKRGHAEMLGIDVESGSLLRVATVTGMFEAFGHELTLETFGTYFDVMVYFARPESFSRNVLGRRGWLDHVRLGLVEHSCKIYFSRYDDESS